MKKKVILAFVLLAIFLAGCMPEARTLKLFDSVTKAPVSGEAVVNGRKVSIKNGILKVHSKKAEIEAKGYEKTVSENQTIYLVPKAYLIIKSNVIPSEILINGKTAAFYIRQNGEYVVSPVEQGNINVKVKSEFCKPFNGTVNISEGKNEISIRLLPDVEKLKNFLSNPPIYSGTFLIAEQGKIDEDNINYVFNVVLKNGKVFQIKHEGTTYDFENGKVFSNGAEIKNKEDIAALLYAKKTVENLFPLSKYIEGLNLEYADPGTISLSGTKTFENRKFNETLKLTFTNSKLNEVKLHIQSDEIENADFEIIIQRTKD